MFAYDQGSQVSQVRIRMGEQHFSPKSNLSVLPDQNRSNRTRASRGGGNSMTGSRAAETMNWNGSPYAADAELPSASPKVETKPASVSLLFPTPTHRPSDLTRPDGNSTMNTSEQLRKEEQVQEMAENLEKRLKGEKVEA